MNITPRVLGERPLLATGYKYNSSKVLAFIATQGVVSTGPCDPYLSRFPEIHYNVSVFSVVHHHLLVNYFNACNALDNQNRIQKADLGLEKYMVTQSGYFELVTTV